MAFVGVAGALAALVGSMIAAGLEAKTLQQVFGVAAFAVAMQFFSDADASKREREPRTARPPLVGSGLAIGLVSSLTGIEGNVLGVPLMYRFMDFPLKEATGYATMAALTTGLISSIMYIVEGQGNILLPARTLGYVDFLSAIPLVVGALLTTRLGETAADKVQFKKGRKYYGVFLVVIAAGMFLW
jgi:uncharacterized membrane protein YfcA